MCIRTHISTPHHTFPKNGDFPPCPWAATLLLLQGPCFIIYPTLPPDVSSSSVCRTVPSTQSINIPAFTFWICCISSILRPTFFTLNISDIRMFLTMKAPLKVFRKIFFSSLEHGDGPYHWYLHLRQDNTKPFFVVVVAPVTPALG